MVGINDRGEKFFSFNILIQIKGRQPFCNDKNRKLLVLGIRNMQSLIYHHIDSLDRGEKCFIKYKKIKAPK